MVLCTNILQLSLTYIHHVSTSRHYITINLPSLNVCDRHEVVCIGSLCFKVRYVEGKYDGSQHYPLYIGPKRGGSIFFDLSRSYNRILGNQESKMRSFRRLLTLNPSTKYGTSNFWASQPIIVHFRGCVVPRYITMVDLIKVWMQVTLGRCSEVKAAYYINLIIESNEHVSNKPLVWYFFRRNEYMLMGSQFYIASQLLCKIFCVMTWFLTMTPVIATIKITWESMNNRNYPSDHD